MKQFTIVVGLPNSGKNEYINRTYNNEEYEVINAESFMDLKVVSYESIEESKKQCFDRVKELLDSWKPEEVTETEENTENTENTENIDNTENTEQVEKVIETTEITGTKSQDEGNYRNIVLVLYSNTPGKWVDFIELTAIHGYTTSFVKPTHNHFFHKSKYSDSSSQVHEIRMTLRSKMEVMKYVDYDDKGYSYVKESDLLRRLVLEFENCLNFISFMRMNEIDNTEKLLESIEKKYGSIIKKQNLLNDRTKTQLEKISQREKERELKKANGENNKVKKKNKNRRKKEDNNDNFYSDTKFEDFDEKFMTEDNFVIMKNRKQRLKEKRKQEISKIDNHEVEEGQEVSEIVFQNEEDIQEDVQSDIQEDVQIEEQEIISSE